MSAVFLFNMVFLFCVIIPSLSMANDADWDAVVGQINQELLPTDKAADDVAPEPEEQWPESQVKWQEDKDQYTVTIGITGITKDKINIDVKDNTIVLSAKDKTGLHEKINVGDNKMYRQEDDRVNWEKIIRVPDDAELKLMTHHFVDGDLNIRIPKKRLKSII